MSLVQSKFKSKDCMRWTPTGLLDMMGFDAIRRRFL